MCNEFISECTVMSILSLKFSHFLSPLPLPNSQSVLPQALNTSALSPAHYRPCSSTNSSLFLKSRHCDSNLL